LSVQYVHQVHHEPGHRVLGCGNNCEWKEGAPNPCGTRTPYWFAGIFPARFLLQALHQGAPKTAHHLQLSCSVQMVSPDNNHPDLCEVSSKTGGQLPGE